MKLLILILLDKSMIFVRIFPYLNYDYYLNKNN